ncbi:TULIP family P47-like protein [Paenibacillus larvae]|uniref:TULIP family P47-like protein n=1 Tax=Paenibacillus larvae TaxID=1464 RepID=UPI00166272A9|nr:TULIP family P47-like protein [Paenibacillus larvae]
MTITHSTSTFNWDTVFAIPIAEANRIIKEQKSSPKHFELNDSNNNFKGDFGEWQIITGGDGNSIRMNIPVRNFQTFLNEDLFTGEFGFQSADLNVQVKLNYLPHENILSNKTTNEQLYDLKIKSTSSDPKMDPVVIGISLKNVEGIFFPWGLKNSLRIDFQTILKEMFMQQIIKWLTLNLKEFNHTFSVVNLNLYISDEKPWAWCKPSYVDYAYTDIEENLDKSLLGVLCMTGGRKGGIQQQQKLDAYVIPESSNAGFLIAQERFLLDVVLPTLPMKFEYSTTNDYEVINASGEAGQYQYILRLKKDRKIKLDRVEVKGSRYDPYMTEMSLSLVNDTLKLEAATETSVGIGGVVGCRTTNWYKLKLAENGKGEQTIAYEEAGQPTITHYVIKEGDNWVWDVIAVIIALLAEAVLAIFTAGASLIIGSIVIAILTGLLAKTPDIIQGWNVNTSRVSNLF